MTMFSQILLLLWKKWLCKRRKWRELFAEIFIPLVLLFMLLGIRLILPVEREKTATVWPAFSVDSLSPSLRPNIVSEYESTAETWRIAFTPQTSDTMQVMAAVGQRLSLNVQGFTNESEMLTYTDDRYGNATDILCGVVFLSDVRKSVRNLQYKIRFPERHRMFHRPLIRIGEWQTANIFPKIQKNTARNSDDPLGGFPGYAEEGFLAVQRAVDVAIMSHLNASSVVESVPVRLARYPYPPSEHNHMGSLIFQMMPVLILLCHVVIVPSLIRDVVLEKEKMLKEFMRLYGLGRHFHWISWFIQYLVIFVTLSIVITIILCAPLVRGTAILQHTSPSLVLVFLLIYAMATITFAFLVSCIFSKAYRASVAGLLMLFLPYFAYWLMTNKGHYEMLRASDKVAASVLHIVAMTFGWRVIGNAEITGSGLNWTTLWHQVGGENLALGPVLVMLLFDTVLYGLLALYLDSVLPGDYGVPKPWYFPIAPAYWPCGKRMPPLPDEERGDPTYTGHFEPSPADVKSGIKLRWLRKEFNGSGSGTVGVACTNMDIKEGEITVLLGQSSAGKSTTLAMIAGLLTPTKGTVYVNDVDIRRNPALARASLGYCPQDDVLFDLMTVEEHLRFYAKLRGLATWQSEVQQLMVSLDLLEHRDTLAHILSGGCKRRLLVAIALIGDPKVLVLDEPTTGMDAEIRRKLWQYLKQHKSERTTLITTHALDEAEVMGDRIAIMAEGVVKCCGSTLFLRDKYDCGYVLAIEKGPQCNVEGINKLIMSHIEEAQVVSEIGSQIEFSLPQESSACFEALFSELDQQKEFLLFASYGIHATTLDDVFLRIGSSQADDPSMMNNDLKQDENEDDQPLLSTSDGNVKFATGRLRFLLQLRAMLIKRGLMAWRNKYFMLMHIIFGPFIFFLMASYFRHHIPTQPEPPLELKPTIYARGGSTLYSYLDMNATAPPGYTMTQIYDAYVEVMNNLGATTLQIGPEGLYGYFPQVSTLEQYLLEEEEISLRRYNREVPFSTDMHDRYKSTFTIDGYFNNQMYHTPAVILNVIDTLLLRLGTGVDYTIKVINHPLPPARLSQAEEQVEGVYWTSMFVSAYMLIGFCFVLGSFAVNIVVERFVRTKHLQLVSGLHMAAFWLGSALWDVLMFMVACSGLLIFSAVFHQDAFIQGGLGATITLFLLFAVAAVPLVYCLSRMFAVASSAYNTIISILIVTAVVMKFLDLFMPVHILLEILAPHFAFLKALGNIFSNYHGQQACGHFGDSLERICTAVSNANDSHPCCNENCGLNCVEMHSNYLSWTQPGIGQELLALVLFAIASIWALVVMESNKWRYHEIRENLKTRRTHPTAENLQLGMLGYSRAMEDDDVMIESQQVWSQVPEDLSRSAHVLVMGLTKYYGSRTAVDNLTFKVSAGECFGLLGANGAGKTTVFQMLTGNQIMSAGQVYIGGHNILTHLSQARKMIGYCPQLDCLHPMLTTRETLNLYARIRGLSGAELRRRVEESIKAFMLSEHVGKLVKHLSVGCKRKLSLAIALIGDPPIVFLDEPTSGMDPVARRRVWALLLRYRDAGRTIVLTSHSMMECETLCTRLAIMVNGQFRCLGTNQHLKEKFGHGYSVIAKVACSAEEDPVTKTQSFIAYIHEKFLGSTLQDTNGGTVHFRIATEMTTLATIFKELEFCRVYGNIQHYSVSQTTLEQVFLFLVRSQNPPGPKDDRGKFSCQKLKSTCKRCFSC